MTMAIGMLEMLAAR